MADTAKLGALLTTAFDGLSAPLQESLDGRPMAEVTELAEVFAAALRKDLVETLLPLWEHGSGATQARARALANLIKTAYDEAGQPHLLLYQLGLDLPDRIHGELICAGPYPDRAAAEAAIAGLPEAYPGDWRGWTPVPLRSDAQLKALGAAGMVALIGD